MIKSFLSLMFRFFLNIRKLIFIKYNSIYRSGFSHLGTMGQIPIVGYTCFIYEHSGTEPYVFRSDYGLTTVLKRDH